MRLTNFFPVKVLKMSLIICLLLISLPTLAWAGEFTAFGPQDFIRETGTPVTVTHNFSVQDPNTEFFLRVYNGGLEDSEAELVSSSIISLSGIQVIGPEKFNQTVKFIETPVILQLDNTIEVEVRAKPGGILIIHIVGIDNEAPGIQIVQPADGSVINETKPQIVVTYSDAVSGIDPTSFYAEINSVDSTNLFTVTSAQATYQVTTDLPAGDNVITVGINDNAGNPASATSSFKVATVRAIPGAHPTSGYAPLTVYFTTNGEDPAGTIEIFRWDFNGDGTWDTYDTVAKDYTHTYNTPGTYNATLYVQSSTGATATASITITVENNPPVATADVIPSNGAVPLTVQLIGSGTDQDGSIVLYEWDFDGDGVYDWSSPSTGNITHTYTAVGTYQAAFRVTDNDGATATASALTVEVRVGPPGSPTASGSANPSIGDAPLTVSFSGTGTDPDGTIVLYEWDFDGDGIYDWSSTSTASTSYTYNDPGTFAAAFRITDNMGLTGVDYVVIRVGLEVGLSIADPDCTFDPTSGESIGITPYLSAPVPAYIVIKNQTGATVRSISIEDVNIPPPFVDSMESMEGGINGGTGWDGPWAPDFENSGSATIQAGSLVHPTLGIPTSGNHILTGPTGEAMIDRSTVETVLDEAGAEAWISYLYQVETTPVKDINWRSLDLLSGPGWEGLIAATGQPWSTETFGLLSPVSWVGYESGIPITPGQVYWIVVKIEMSGDDGPDPIYLWVDPDPISEPNTASAAVAVTDACYANNGFNRIMIVAMEQGRYDEIKIATSFEDFTVGPIAEEPFDYPVGEDVAVINGWTASGFWHLVEDGVSPYPNSYSPTHSWWYGQDSTGNYSNGYRNWGELISPTIDLPSGNAYKLSFWSWEQTESAGTSWDRRIIYISTNGGSSWTQIHQRTGNTASWVKVEVDLSAYSGESIKIKFRFDTIDSVLNGYRGWYIDDVIITLSTSVSWDGKDDNGFVVHDGLYYAILKYQFEGSWHELDLTYTTGGTRHHFPFGSGCDQRSSFPTYFSPFEDNLLPLTFRLCKAQEVTAFMGPLWTGGDPARIRTIANRKAFPAGQSTIYWDGLDDQGNIAQPPPGDSIITGFWRYDLPDNAIYVTGGKPEISNVSADNNYFSPFSEKCDEYGNDEGITISYTVSENVLYVELRVYSVATSALVRTLQENNVQVGEHTIFWDGKNNNDEYVDIGDYRVGIMAVDPEGNESMLRYTLVRLDY